MISIPLFLLVSNVIVNANQDSIFTNLIKERQKCVTLIVDKNKNQLGTGLVTYFTGPKGSTKIGVITNWHVIENIDSVYVRFNTDTTFQDIYAMPIPKILMPSNLDIALLRPDLSGKNMEVWKGTVPLGRDKIGKANSISEGDKLFYIGFPLGLGVGQKNRPLVRMGYGSQKIEGQTTFLIDGFASHGNSGSPVFSVEDGKLVGVIMAFKADFITAENKSEGLMIRLPYNAGIAVAITSDEILRIVMELFPKLEEMLEGSQEGK